MGTKAMAKIPNTLILVNNQIKELNKNFFKLCANKQEKNKFLRGGLIKSDLYSYFRELYYF